VRWQADDNQSIIYLLLNISKNKSLRKKFTWARHARLICAFTTA